MCQATTHKVFTKTRTLIKALKYEGLTYTRPTVCPELHKNLPLASTHFSPFVIALTSSRRCTDAKVQQR